LLEPTSSLPLVPPPMPSPPPVSLAFVPQVHTIYFKSNNYDFSSNNLETISAVANQYKERGAAQLRVTGYTDLSGSARGNEKLALQRARAVAAALVKMGVPATAILVGAYANAEARATTRQGMRDPQDWRVEISLQLEDRRQ
jgi:OmpA-OmpF porin, OOP family